MHFNSFWIMSSRHKGNKQNNRQLILGRFSLKKLSWTAANLWSL